MFDATYVINLDRSPERWTNIQKVCDAAGFQNVIRFSAIDGAALGAEGLADLQQRGILSSDLSSFAVGCREGEIGCAVSHALVLDDIVKRGWRTALILEDDIELAGRPASWRRRFEAAYRDLPDDWELWYLYRCFDIEHRVQRVTSRTVVPWTPQGGAAYALTADGARKLRHSLTPVSSAVDRVYMKTVQSRAVRAFAASPLLIDPGQMASVINRANPGKEWVENGINRPPEYWPETHLAHLGEVAPPRHKPSRLQRAGTWALDLVLRRRPVSP